MAGRSGDYRFRETKKPKKGAKKVATPTLPTALPTASPEVQVIKRGKASKEAPES